MNTGCSRLFDHLRLSDGKGRNKEHVSKRRIQKCKWVKKQRKCAVHIIANTGAHTRNKSKSNGNTPDNGSYETARSAASTSGYTGKGKRRSELQTSAKSCTDPAPLFCDFGCVRETGGWSSFFRSSTHPPFPHWKKSRCSKKLLTNVYMKAYQAGYCLAVGFCGNV